MSTPIRRVVFPLLPAVLFGLVRPPQLTADVGDPVAGRSGAKRPQNTGLVPLNPQETVLIDVKGKRVLIRSKVVFRSGTLEMLACLKHTKEHESILSVDAQAFVIHSALLRIGAKQGKPVRFTPEYAPPHGQHIDVFLTWTGVDGRRHRVRAQEWVRYSIHRYHAVLMKHKPADLTIPKDEELRYAESRGELLWYGPMNAEKRDQLLARSNSAAYRKAIRWFFEQAQSRPMSARWVFAGSGFRTDEDTGKQYYWAEGGDLICVANFPSATLDIAAESSATGDALLFEAWQERIPPVDTEVMIELIPVSEKNSTTDNDKRGQATQDTAARSGRTES